MTRAHISRKVELAAALLQIPADDGSRAIPHEHAKEMSADQIISLFHRDHYPIRKEAGGPDEPWNITWRFIGPHRKKTAKVDIPQAAKVRRLSAEQEDFQRKVLARPCGEQHQRTGNWPQGRKLRSRGFERRRKP